MKALLIILIPILLSGCAPRILDIAKINPDSSIGVPLPVNGKLGIYIPLDQLEEKLIETSSNGKELVVKPGEALAKATSSVGIKYFSQVDRFSLEEPVHYILKLKNHTIIDPTRRQYHVKVFASLYDTKGTLIEKMTVSGSSSPGSAGYDGALLSAFSAAMFKFYDQLFFNNSYAIATQVDAHPPGLLLFDKSMINGPIELTSTGTGFFINDAGDVITNYHVIQKCNAVTVTANGTETGAYPEAFDKENDLAVLSTNRTTEHYGVFADESYEGRLGEEIITIGYPLYGVLSRNPSLTTGNVSALAGYDDNDALIQISAPVQSGSSGSPLISRDGLIYGVVQSKINAIRLARYTGDIAQNLNFAVRKNVAFKLLKERGIKFSTSMVNKGEKPETADIAEQAAEYTVQIMCYG